MFLKSTHPFQPKRLPLKRIKRSSFKRTLIRAKKELHLFENLLQRIPNPYALLTSLLATEAMAALESQKIRISVEKFFLLYLTHSKKNKNLLLPIYYYSALKRACRAIYTQRINKKMLCAIHELVKKGAPHYIQVGSYRTKQNWIGPEGCKKEQAFFFPPSPKTMRSAMQNLLQYCEKKERNPLIQIAIIIAQFLIIHPFRDGNGRVARILIPLLFYQKKILPYPLLFFSRYLKDHRVAYFQNLFDITGKNKWEQWVQFFLKGIILQVGKERHKAEKIYRLYLKLLRKLSVQYPRQSFLFFLFSQPVFSRSYFIQRYSQDVLKDLEGLKIIKPFKKGYYFFPALLKIVK